MPEIGKKGKLVDAIERREIGDLLDKEGPLLESEIREKLTFNLTSDEVHKHCKTMRFLGTIRRDGARWTTGEQDASVPPVAVRPPEETAAALDALRDDLRIATEYAAREARIVAQMAKEFRALLRQLGTREEVITTYLQRLTADPGEPL
jgi:hypothetical protein